VHSAHLQLLTCWC